MYMDTTGIDLLVRNAVRLDKRSALSPLASFYKLHILYWKIPLNLLINQNTIHK